jgi:hypothetical protein
VFGVADEGAGGLAWMAFTLCEESFTEGGYHEEEDASVDQP